MKERRRKYIVRVLYRILFDKKSERRKIREKEIHLKMNSLRKAMTQIMSSIGQPLTTKRRWMMTDKKIVFGNRVIPCDHTGDFIL